MKDVMNNQEFLEAGMFAWNKISYLLEGTEAAPFDNTEEFQKFYEMLMDRLFAEEEA